MCLVRSHRRRIAQSGTEKTEELVKTITTAVFTKASNTAIKTRLFAVSSHWSITQDHSHIHHVDQKSSHILSQTGQSEQEIIDALLDAYRIETFITKTSELDVWMVHPAKKKFQHPSVWIGLGVSALVAMLYLLI